MMIFPAAVLAVAVLLLSSVVSSDPVVDLKTPPMGFMSWERFRCQVDCVAFPDDCINEQLYINQAEALVLGGYAEAGYTQVSIDDCWTDGRDHQGKLQANSTRFPHGIKWLAYYLHAEGLTLGIYADAGVETCGHYVGSQGHEQVDAQTFAEWGVDYLKLDGCHIGHGKSYEEVYTAFGKALKAAASTRPIAYSCSWPAYIGSNESTKPFKDMYHKAGCNTWRNYNDVDNQWSSVKDIILHWSRYWKELQQIPKGSFNDADMLLVGDDHHGHTLTQDQAQLQMGFWALIASPLFIGGDVRKITNEYRKILLNKDVIAINQDPSRKQADCLEGCGEPVQVWSKSLANGLSQAVAFINLQDYKVGVVAYYYTVKGTIARCVDVWSENPQKDLCNGATTDEWKITQVEDTNHLVILKIEARNVAPTSHRLLRIDYFCEEGEGMAQPCTKWKEEEGDIHHGDLSKPTDNPPDIMVVDMNGDIGSDSPTVLAIQACAGLFNRNDTVAGAAYTVWGQQDLDWFREIEAITNPQFIPARQFLAKCLETVAKGYIHYNYDQQQVVVPNLVTLAGVLDAIPLIATDETTSLINQTNAKMVFDAEKKFNGFSAYDATKYMFEHHAHETTTMAKSDPGYDYKKGIIHPPLTQQPHLKLADYIVKERLFNFFLLEGCIDYTKEHALMESMTQHDKTQWPQPIAVFGYDDVSLGGPGDLFESETLCVKGHNMGQVATDEASDLSFFSRKAPILVPLQQNPSPKEEYNESTTYVALVVGDGDNVGMMKDRNYPWVQQRLSYCRNESLAPHNCFPISWTVSPHTLKIAPDLLDWYYAQGQKTGQDFFLLPPSGHLYAYPSVMQDEDQASFVEKTEDAARLLNSSGTVDWEFELTWKGAINNFFPRYANKSVIRGLFAVNVPFNLPTYAFGKNEFYKVIGAKGGLGGDGAVILFRPREWRGTSGKSDIPFGKKSNLSEKDMAAEINGYPKGTVCYIYLTSDGGADLDSLYNMVPHLENHVKVVNHEVATDMALQRSMKLDDGEAASGNGSKHVNLRHEAKPMDH